MKKKNTDTLKNLPVGSKIEFRSNYDMTNGVRKGDTVFLTKRKGNHKGAKSFWSDGNYRWNQDLISDDYKVLKR